MKLDRYVARCTGGGRKEARRLIAGGRVSVAGEAEKRWEREVDRFTVVAIDGRPAGTPERALYLMLHKPAGILSATKDEQFRTVIDLIDDPDRESLHIAGRLDRASTGLVLLTNDGRWSKALMDPERKVAKGYLVETDGVIPEEAVAAFAAGFHFATEDIVTRTAVLELLGPRRARVILHEGRYHQIKRMFHRLELRVTALHRESIGELAMPEDLEQGAWRALSADEKRLAASDFH